MRSFAGPALSVAVAVLGGVLLVPRLARGSLTSSETGQIASYVAEARVVTAERVRALVARPDLTSEESAAVLEGAMASLAFTEMRAAYFHEMLYGPSSLPSRSVVAVAVTHALTARASGVVGRHEADLDLDEPSRTELGRIFAFIDADVANAGQPHGAAHDPNAGIGAASYDDAGRAVAGVIAAHPRWLSGDAVIPAAAEPIRAQLQLAALDLANDTTTRRFDVADRLGLKGTRRAMLTELGVLLLDDGHTDPVRIDRVRALLARIPGARDGLAAVALFDSKVPLRARADVVSIPVAPTLGDDDPWRTPAREVAGPRIDPDLTGIAHALADVVVHHALDARPDLRAIAEKDAAAANADSARTLGAPANASARATLTSAVTLVALDAPTTLSLALVGLLSGRPERCALLSDALGVLAAASPAGGTTFSVGRASDPSGAAAISNVHVAPAGFVTAFTLSNHAYVFSRDPVGPLGAMRDGAPVTLATLAALDGARVPVSAGTAWSAGGIVFAKMAGAPQAGVAPGGRVRLIGPSDGPGVDAIVSPAPAEDVVVEGNVEVSGEAAVVLRAIATSAGFKGIALVLDASRVPTRASIRAWDDAGKMTEIVPAADLPAAPTYSLRLAVKGTKLEVKIAGLTLHAEVPADLLHGDIGLVARRGGSIDAQGWAVKRP